MYISLSLPSIKLTATDSGLKHNMAAKIIDPYGFLVYISVTSASGPSITCHDEKTWDYNTFLMSQSSLPLEMVPQSYIAPARTSHRS